MFHWEFLEWLTIWAGVNERGKNAKQLNTFINIKTAEKRLQLRADKCHTLSIAYTNVKSEDAELYINNWSELHDKDDNLIEKIEGKIMMKNVNEQQYLG